MQLAAERDVRHLAGRRPARARRRRGPTRPAPTAARRSRHARQQRARCCAPSARSPRRFAAARARPHRPAARPHPDQAHRPLDRSSSRTPDYWGSLSKGPGRYEQGSFPGLGQTTGIAGHRTTFAAPFRHIDSIRDGDSIVVEMPYAHLHLPRAAPQDRRQRRLVDHEEGRLRRARALGLPPALQRRPALRRLRPPGEREARRREPGRQPPAPASALRRA